MRVVGPGGAEQDHLLYVLAIQQQAAAWTVRVAVPILSLSAVPIAGVSPTLSVSLALNVSLLLERFDEFARKICPAASLAFPPKTPPQSTPPLVNPTRCLHVSCASPRVPTENPGRGCVFIFGFEQDSRPPLCGLLLLTVHSGGWLHFCSRVRACVRVFVFACASRCGAFFAPFRFFGAFLWRRCTGGWRRFRFWRSTCQPRCPACRPARRTTRPPSARRAPPPKRCGCACWAGCRRSWRTQRCRKRR